MQPHKDHRQRKRDQFYHHGSDAFADHELLELLLFYGIARKDVNPLAHALLAEFGSLEAVFAVIGASIVLGERMSGREYVGSALVLIAVILAQTEPDFIKKLLKIHQKANNN